MKKIDKENEKNSSIKLIYIYIYIYSLLLCMSSNYSIKMSSTVPLHDTKCSDIKTYLQHFKDHKCMCWWCCHVPDMQSQTPVPIAISIRQSLSTETKWGLKGYFCSFSCGLAYIHHELHAGLPHDTVQITRNLWLLYAGLPMVEQVQKAQSKHVLQAFGGDRTIADFRKNSRSVQCKGNILVFSITEALDLMTAAAATAQRPYSKTNCSSSMHKRRMGRAALKPQNTLRGNPQNIDMRRRTTQRLDYSKAEIFQHRAPSRDPTKVLTSTAPPGVRVASTTTGLSNCSKRRVTGGRKKDNITNAIPGNIGSHITTHGSSAASCGEPKNATINVKNAAVLLNTTRVDKKNNTNNNSGKRPHNTKSVPIMDIKKNKN